MYMLGIEYIICSMASRCVSAISALQPSIAAFGFASGFRSDIADTYLEAMLYIYIYNYIYMCILLLVMALGHKRTCTQALIEKAVSSLCKNYKLFWTAVNLLYIVCSITLSVHHESTFKFKKIDCNLVEAVIS